MFARRWWPCAGVLIGLFAWPLESPGAVLTFAFEGQIAHKRDTLGLLPFANEGDTFVYTFSFDEYAPDGYPESDAGLYAGIGSSFKVAQTEIAGGPPTIEIIHPRDLVTVNSSMFPESPGLRRDGLVIITLSDQAESNALTNTLLPTEAYNLAPFASKYFSLSFYLSSPPPPGVTVYEDLGGTIDAMYLIPEPGTLVLVLGSATLLARRNRRHL